MYISASDFDKYRNFLSKNIEEAFDVKTKRDIKTRCEIIHGHLETLALDIFENPDVEEFYTVAKENSSRCIDFLVNNKSALVHILEIENTDSSAAYHGINVATLAVALAEELGAFSQENAKIEQMFLGALLHDIDHQFTQLEFMKKTPDFTDEELKVYSSHPLNGANRIKDFNHFDQLVINIILQHEELSDGSGFPRGMIAKDLDPFVQIVTTANIYDRLTSFEGISHQDALKIMLIDNMGHCPLKHLKALQEVLKQQQLVF